MNESLLHALIELFAIIADVKHFKNHEIAIKVVEKYFYRNYGKSQSEKWTQYFDDHVQKYHLNLPNNKKPDISIYHERIEEICSEINKEFEQKQKFWLILQLLEFTADSDYDSQEEIELVKDIAATFNIDKDDFEQSKNLVISENESITLTDKILVISGNQRFIHSQARHLYNEKMLGKIFVLQLKNSDTYLLKFFGKHNLFLNGRNIKPERTYIWAVGAVIRGHIINRIYYSNMVSAFIRKENIAGIELKAYEVSYSFKNSSKGLKSLDFEAESGQLVGIIGGSGSGKSTLLNVLNGNLIQKTGEILINGYDIHKDKQELEGIIGYVPQEDLLFEELTVYQNLYYNAKLCFSACKEEQIDTIVNKTIVDFDLKEATDLKVGDPLNKILSGGQRKRLNIALELMREPSLLFVDEPTSGLSSMDSEKIINLLKRQTFKEKLVILTIHQPSSDIYKLLDKIIVLDQGGRLIYSGNPLDTISYFREQSNYINPDDNECVTCGNVNSEQVLRIVESRLVNEFGKLSRRRKRPPEEWEEIYKAEIKTKKEFTPVKKKELPDNNFSAPNHLNQFLIFFQRNLISKLSNHQYVLLILLEAPILAFILGLFTKQYISSEKYPDQYIFAYNENLPAFIFMSVIVALFLGLVISTEEILRDKKIIKRESFLNLSRWSYINSKVLLLIIISAIQALLFVIVGNSFLEINGLYFAYWLMLFSTAVCANLIGLNISSAFNSVVSAYIAIPFVLVPQLLLSGAVVDFSKMHKDIKSAKYTPIYGDLMASRWAYEGLMVEQFNNNPFQKNFFEVDRKISHTNYMILLYIQKLESTYSNLSIIEKDTKVKDRQVQLLENELRKLYGFNSDTVFLTLADKLAKNYDSEDYKKIFNDELESLKNKLISKQETYKKEKETIFKKLIKTLGSEKAFIKLKEYNQNQSVANYVLNNYSYKKITVYNNEIIQLKDPIYQIPESPFGRAHFYAPVKKIANLEIDTFWFNLIVLWVTTILMYLLLQADLFRKGIEYLDNIKAIKGWSKKVLRV
ncbi:MAG: ABC transporter [Bacteroidetes bacterium]|nr:MAG: ABC transporter [Bacteroidota bacterium]